MPLYVAAGSTAVCKARMPQRVEHKCARLACPIVLLDIRQEEVRSMYSAIPLAIGKTSSMKVVRLEAVLVLRVESASVGPTSNTRSSAIPLMSI